jgi:hypothetical protein
MDFANILKIPPKPTSIAEAERKWREEDTQSWRLLRRMLKAGIS